MDLIIRFVTLIASQFVFPKSARKPFRLRLRSRWYGRKAYRKGKVGKGCVFRGYLDVNVDTKIGNRVHTSDLQVFGRGGVEIGDYTHIGPECVIIPWNHKYKGADALPFGHENEERPVKIGACVWIGHRVTILPGTHIGDGAIIQAGAVVHGEIPPCAIAGGNPAKVFAYRDKDKYYRLKAEGKFFLREM